MNTQSHIPTVTAATFGYEFGLDFFNQKIVIYNRVKNKSMTITPSEAQQKASDATLDPHRRNLYQAAYDYWRSQR